MNRSRTTWVVNGINRLDPGNRLEVNRIEVKRVEVMRVEVKRVEVKRVDPVGDRRRRDDDSATMRLSP